MRNILSMALVTSVVTSLVAGMAFADPVGGEVGKCTRIGALSVKYFDVRCVGGEATQVLLKGDGDTDLDMYVYDSAGNLIDFDDDGTDACVVTYIPRWTGTFTIKVVNRGTVYNDFCFVVR